MFSSMLEAARNSPFRGPMSTARCEAPAQVVYTSQIDFPIIGPMMRTHNGGGTGGGAGRWGLSTALRICASVAAPPPVVAQ
ncbi:Phosphate carrier protein, mitochondrial [Eumeta japonica]|uniref:Phosphate carrier protein, mitochondrial n=1 Tax=Eumeta variegata TaxID=151549 RepID=A0A4C1VCP7_EUMVA|nr:Phosphate carrier protein, mitochondrial [Eumeta japonica]